MSAARAARLAEQFVTQNRSLMSLLDVRIDRDYDGNELRLIIQAGSAIGAVPLISPTTARPDYGLVVQPRFPWAGNRPHAGRDGLANQSNATPTATAPALRAARANLGVVVHDSNETEVAARFT